MSHETSDAAFLGKAIPKMIRSQDWFPMHAFSIPVFPSTTSKHPLASFGGHFEHKPQGLNILNHGMNENAATKGPALECRSPCETSETRQSPTTGRTADEAGEIWGIELRQSSRIQAF